MERKGDLGAPLRISFSYKGDEEIDKGDRGSIWWSTANSKYTIESLYRL